MSTLIALFDTFSHVLAHALAACFFVNAVPHLVQGLSGHHFQSPFAKPPGIGESTPKVNVLWGSANLIAAFALFNIGDFQYGLTLDTALFTLLAILTGTTLASHFGKVRN